MKKIVFALIFIFIILLVGAVFSYKYINNVSTANAKTSNNKVVIISPHPDDETIGMGGFIQRLKSEGKDVHIVVMCSGNGIPYKDHVSNYYNVNIPNNASAADRKKLIREDAFVRVMNIYGVSYEMIGLNDSGTTDEDVLAVMERMYKEGYGEFYTTTGEYNVDHQHCADAMEMMMNKYPSLKYRQFAVYWHATDNGTDYVPKPLVSLHTDYNVTEYLPKKLEALNVYYNIQIFDEGKYQTDIERIYYV